MNAVERLLRGARERLPDLRYDSSFWRTAMRAGAVHGPDALVRYSPTLFGLFFGAALPAARERVLDNLRRVRGPAHPARDAADVARVFATFASSLTEAFALASDRGERLVAAIEGDKAFLEARGLGRGLVVLTAHTSGWHAAGPVLATDDTSEALLVMRQERDRAAGMVQKLASEGLGARVLALSDDDPLGALPILSHLRKNGVVAFQIDRLPTNMRGRAIRFLGHDAKLPDGPFRLAALAGAPVVVVLGRRLGFMRYALHAHTPIFLPRRPSEAQLDEAARVVARDVEAFVRAHPTHWFDFG